MDDKPGFDPSKAEIGAFAFLNGRQGLVDPRELVGDGRRREKLASEEERAASSNIGRSNDSRARIAEPLNKSEKKVSIGNSDDRFEKEARGMPHSENDAVQDRTIGNDKVHDSSRYGAIDSDMNVHGAHETPKPSIKDLVKARLTSLRAEVTNKEEEMLKKRVERQESMFEENQSMSTDISVNRKGMVTEEGQPFSEPTSMSKHAGSLISLLEDEDLNPVKLMLILDSAWGSEWYGWEIETINQTAEMDGFDIARINQDKIMALKVLKNSNHFFDDPRVFEKVCLSFAGKQVDWGHIQEPLVHEIAACVALVERYVKEAPFSDDVAAYVAGAAIRDGYVLLPATLSFAEIPFSLELASNLGDEAIERQENLMSALDSEDYSIFESSDAVQYMRLIKCQYHVQDKIDEAKA